MEQRILSSEGHYAEFDQWIDYNGLQSILMVCDSSIAYQKLFCTHLDELKEKGIRIPVFQDFQPNPLYESVVKGVKLYRKEKCEGIVAVGGGSAIDVAKCIKLYSHADGNGEYGEWLDQQTIPNNLPFLAFPTTAGTGSEATRYAVVYYGGEKQSITDNSLIPDAVLMDPAVLETLPDYQKKATMMDALCHAIESYWSVNSTDESKAFSKYAIRTIIDQMDGYLNNTEQGRKNMQMAAYYAGKAINITQTTAGHAMCYKITSLFHVSHGHAAILCDRVLYSWMIDNTDKCIDSRGKQYLQGILKEIAQAMGCENAKEGAEKLNVLFRKLDLPIPEATDEQYTQLKTSVNSVRLKNHPIALDINTIDALYHMILR